MYSIETTSALQRYIKKLYDCTDYDSKLVESTTLTRHQIQKHTFEKLFKCFLCYKQLVTKNIRKRHIRSHTDVELCQS